MSTTTADIASQLISAQQDMLTQRVAYKMMKVENDAQQALIEMIDRSAQPAAPAPGTGLVVDRQA